MPQWAKYELEITGT